MSLRLERLPVTDDELWFTVKALWGVEIPRHTCGDPTHTAPFQAFSDAYFGRQTKADGTQVKASVVLWHGSRGFSGKSFMMSILGLTKAFLMGSDVNLLGGSLAQSANIHQHMRAALYSKNSPRDLILTEGNTLIELSNQAKIRPLTASQRTVRGPHPPFLLLDEIDEMDLDILDAALGQPMPQVNYLGEIIDPFTVLCSTWQNPDGTFTEIRRRFQERDLPMLTWCFRCTSNDIDGWLSQQTIEEKRSIIPSEMWRVEYELGEPSIGNRAFDSEAVEEMFCLPFAWDLPETYVKAKQAKDFEEVVFAEYKGEGDFVVAADWGRQEDYTVVSVFRYDRDPIELAYYLRVNRRPYPVMIGHYNEAIKTYHAAGIHDATGVGVAVQDYLDVRARGFTLTGERRAAMLTEYVSAVENRKFAIPRIPSAYYEHKYARYEDLFSLAKAQGYHLPDTVCSFALATKHIAYSVPGFNLPNLKKSDEPSAIAKVLDANARKIEGSELAPWHTGDVYVKDDFETSYSLLV